MVDRNEVPPHVVEDDSDPDLVFDVESVASSLPDPGVDVWLDADAVTVTASEISDVSSEDSCDSWPEEAPDEEFRGRRRAQELQDGLAFRAWGRLRMVSKSLLLCEPSS
jgi:hypothetical protein